LLASVLERMAAAPMAAVAMAAQVKQSLFYKLPSTLALGLRPFSTVHSILVLT
jgi:hypothetical protein